ncbi:hypothetical protein [Sporolactobacillus terrae]|uniref:Uncharacterized protein n=1 Tax=Sporolactobacillus terrae TaxID=269673 RepID=A0A410D944_9BACL|nr:hypothetical protein [Sporolactobacillus terrae]QAA22647.1 hypothetical protein C0674_08400 [Sporolactobacillus terrae]QAA25621.1 hypothetical protein C0679_08380 [Sporolactobacillus terrae]UAK17430.1 hypothetical protein K7399_05705 [Sporolactobacillus terrae]BBN98974.1 hypothetical protein St703_16790 [Sporolactobacillus terrae]
MFEQLKNYWKNFAEEYRQQVIAFGLSMPLFIAIPALLTVLMVHGAFLTKVFLFLILLAFFAVFVLIPIILLMSASFGSKRFQLYWIIVQTVFFVFWIILFQIAHFYF